MVILGPSMTNSRAIFVAMADRQKDESIDWEEFTGCLRAHFRKKLSRPRIPPAAVPTTIPVRFEA